MNEQPYCWQGIDHYGNGCHGVRYCDSVSSLQQQLSDAQISLISAHKQPFWQRSWRANRLNFKEREQFTEQLATTLEQKIPLKQALKMLASQQPNARLCWLATFLSHQLEQGLSLSLALQQSHQFPQFYVQLVATGEQIGALSAIFTQLDNYMQRTRELRQSLRRALSYPLLVFGMALATLALMFHFIIPKFRALFSELSTPLPPLTQDVLFIASHLHLISLLIITFGLLLIMLPKLSRRYAPQLWQRLDRQCYRLPILGRIRQLICWERLVTALKTSSDCGLPLLAGLKNIGQLCPAGFYQQQLHQVIEMVKSGQSFYQSCQQNQLFSAHARQLIHMGEESGTLEQMLAKIVQLYRQQLDTSLRVWLDLLEPIMMAFIGIVVGTIVIAMYLPIFNLGNIVHP